MGRGSRHSKNAGGMGTEALTYHERAALGYGTLKERLGKDSQLKYYECSLTLQPAVNPVATSHGILYSKEAILDYYLAQKKAQKEALVAWEADEARKKLRDDRKAELQNQAHLMEFERRNLAAASDRTSAAIAERFANEAEEVSDRVKTVSSGFSIEAHASRAKTVKSFWQAQDTPDAEIQVEKPDGVVRCPATGKKLTMKELTPVKFTRVPEGCDGMYMDPLSNDTFKDSSKLVLLKATGDVLLESTYVKCVKPSGVYEGKKVKEKDVIKLAGGGTGYAGHDGEKLSSAKHFALGPGSGRADLRGQAAAGASRFGLSFAN